MIYEITYDKPFHPRLQKIVHNLKEISRLLESMEYSFHSIASLITINCRQAFEEDLQKIFTTLLKSRSLCRRYLHECHQDNLSAKTWHQARYQFQGSALVLKGYPEIISENFQGHLVPIRGHLESMIYIAQEILHLSNGLKVVTQDFQENFCLEEPSLFCSISSVSQSACILIIDPCSETRELLFRRFLSSNHRILQIDTPEKALEIMTTQSVDLILLEVSQPEIDSKQIIHKFKQTPQTAAIPIIVVTLSLKNKAITSYIQAGAEDYIHLDFDTVLLFTRVNLVLKNKFLQQQNQHYQQLLAIYKDESLN